MTQNGQLPPAELAPIAQGQLANEAAAAWNAMNQEARKRRLELVPTGSMSSYRTLAQQRILYARYLAGGNLAADPGTSNHGWGVAVDVATIEMRTLIDHIGVKFGWSKKWSDAQGEWWHIKYQPGHYSGPDPGPYGQRQPFPKPPEGVMAIHAVVKQNGAIELFCEVEDGPKKGEVFHTWQSAANSPWWGAEKGKRNAAWQTFGTPGK
jgi:hypothetical protein